MNPILKWALQILLQPGNTSTDESVSDALALIGINADQVQVNCQPLHSIFSMIGENASVIKKNIRWQVLDPENIVYPTESANSVTLNIPELEQDWERFSTNENLALALIEKYGTFLSISSQVPHISFYDAVKSAAAIHDCLSDCANKDKPFLFVSGDFSGIQEAIYTIASSGALKTLRARSFMLEFLTEHIIYEIQQTTDCGRYGLVFSGGGGFSLLVPNTDDNRNAINAFIKIINTWVLEQFDSQLFLAVHCEPLQTNDIKGNLFAEKWELIAEKLRKQKWRKFSDNDNFKDLFCPKTPEHLANQAACQITHRDDLPESEMAYLNEIEGRVTKLAYRLWRLGNRLTRFNSIVRLPESKNNFRNGTLRFPTHNKHQYAEYKVNRPDQVSSDYEARWLMNNWDLDNYKDNKTFPILFGHYVRSVADLSNGEARRHEEVEYQRDRDKEMRKPERITASFSGLAKSAQGSELIGCLRMDVDDSGEVFSEVSRLGIAAVSNLSRSMNLFFKGYLNQICALELGNLTRGNYPVDITGEKVSIKRGRDISIVYAGGDDLFIVGAWDEIAELAFDINACFREFSCCNPKIHLSGGVTLHKPKFPLYQMARMAKQAEGTAKENEDSVKAEKKNSFALFYSVELQGRNAHLNKNTDPRLEQELDRIAIVSRWDEYDDVIQLAKQLQQVYPYLSHGFYRQLFEVLKIWQEQGVLYLPMMSHTKRQLDRIQPQTPELQSLRESLFRQDITRKLHIPLNWIEHLNRHARGEN